MIFKSIFIEVMSIDEILSLRFAVLCQGVFEVSKFEIFSCEVSIKSLEGFDGFVFDFFSLEDSLRSSQWISLEVSCESDSCGFHVFFVEWLEVEIVNIPVRNKFVFVHLLLSLEVVVFDDLV